MLDRGQFDEFAERGFLVLPQAVPPEVVAAAAEAIDELIERDPPGADVRGPFNYFRAGRAGPGPGRAADRQPGIRAGRVADRAGDAGRAVAGAGGAEHPAVPAPARHAPHRRFPARAGRAAGDVHHAGRGADVRPARPGRGEPVGLARHPPDPRGVLPRARARGVLRRGRLPADPAARARAGRPARPGTCCSRTTCSATTSAGIPRGRCGAPSTSGSSGPATTPGGASSSQDPWLDYDAVRSDSGERRKRRGIQRPAGSLATQGGDLRRRSRGRAARRSLCEQFG